jgi:hypothetical protein
MAAINPTNNTGIIIDEFIAYADNHLKTVMGTVTTVSSWGVGPPPFLIPTPVQTPGPAIITWTGYTVTPAQPSFQIPEPTVEELLAKVPPDNITYESVSEASRETGKEFISDGGDALGTTESKIKSQLPDDFPPYESIGGQAASDYTARIIESTSNISIVESQTENGEEKKAGDEKERDNSTVKIKCLDLDIPSAAKELPAALYDKNLSPNYRIRDVSIGAFFGQRIRETDLVDLSLSDFVCNLQSLCVNILEPLKQKYPKIRVNSAFRGTASLGGGRISQHQKGEAVDIQIGGLAPSAYVPIANWCIANLPFDQLIFEHGNSIWLHISHKRNGSQRKELLTMKDGNYESGLVLYYKDKK